VTTMPTIEKADMYGAVIRSHMAKMISVFAIEVLGKQPDTNKICYYKDTKEETVELNYWMKTACQLNLM